MTLEKALNTAEEAKKPRPQATFSNEPVKVTFSKQAYNRRNHDEEPSETEFHIVYIDGEEVGEATLLWEGTGNFDIAVTMTRSAQPYAFQVLRAAVRFFKTRNISITYYD